MRKDAFDEEVARRDTEIGDIAAELVRDRGMSPWQALAEAREIMVDRRTGRRRARPMTV